MAACLVLLMGSPGSGKSTIASRLVREQVGFRMSPYDPKNNGYATMSTVCTSHDKVRSCNERFVTHSPLLRSFAPHQPADLVEQLHVVSYDDLFDEITAADGGGGGGDSQGGAFDVAAWHESRIEALGRATVLLQDLQASKSRSSAAASAGKQGCCGGGGNVGGSASTKKALKNAAKTQKRSAEAPLSPAPTASADEIEAAPAAQPPILSVDGAVAGTGGGAAIPSLSPAPPPAPTSPPPLPRAALRLVVLDDTFHFRSMRRAARRVARGCGAGLVVVWAHAPLAACLARNAERPPQRRVPEASLRRTFASLEPPGGLSAAEAAKSASSEHGGGGGGEGGGGGCCGDGGEGGEDGAGNIGQASLREEGAEVVVLLTATDEDTGSNKGGEGGGGEGADRGSDSGAHGGSARGAGHERGRSTALAPDLASVWAACARARDRPLAALPGGDGSDADAAAAAAAARAVTDASVLHAADLGLRKGLADAMATALASLTSRSSAFALAPKDAAVARKALAEVLNRERRLLLQELRNGSLGGPGGAVQAFGAAAPARGSAAGSAAAEERTASLRLRFARRCAGALRHRAAESQAGGSEGFGGSGGVGEDESDLGSALGVCAAAIAQL